MQNMSKTDADDEMEVLRPEGTINEKSMDCTPEALNTGNIPGNGRSKEDSNDISLSTEDHGVDDMEWKALRVYNYPDAPSYDSDKWETVRGSDDDSTSQGDDYSIEDDLADESDDDSTDECDESWLKEKAARLDVLKEARAKLKKTRVRLEENEARLDEVEVMLKELQAKPGKLREEQLLGELPERMKACRLTDEATNVPRRKKRDRSDDGQGSRKTRRRREDLNMHGKIFPPGLSCPHDSDKGPDVSEDMAARAPVDDCSRLAPLKGNSQVYRNVEVWYFENLTCLQ